MVEEFFSFIFKYFWSNYTCFQVISLYISITIILINYQTIIYAMVFFGNCVLPKNLLFEYHKATHVNNTNEILGLVSRDPKHINIPWYNDGVTPFLRACSNGNTLVVRTMLQLGADVNSQTKKQENCFYLAAYNHIRSITNNDASCIHALYYAGADINQPNEYGINALQLAAMFGHYKLIEWLIHKRAKLNIKPNPYLLAKAYGHYCAANFLKPYYQRVRTL